MLIGPREWSPQPKSWEKLVVGSPGYVEILKTGHKEQELLGHWKPSDKLSEVLSKLPGGAVTRFVLECVKSNDRLEELLARGGAFFSLYGIFDFRERKSTFYMSVFIRGFSDTVAQDQDLVVEMMRELGDLGYRTSWKTKGDFVVEMDSVRDVERARKDILSVAQKVGVYEYLRLNFGWEGGYLLGRTHVFTAIADTIFREAWFSREKEKGRKFRPGEDPKRLVPRTSEKAFEAARNLVLQLEQENGAFLEELYKETLSRLEWLAFDSERIRVAFGEALAKKAMGEEGILEEVFPGHLIKVPGILFIL